MSNPSPNHDPVDVRVIEPIPPYGKQTIIQTVFGQAKVARQLTAGNTAGPQRILPARATRVTAKIRNAFTETVYLHTSESGSVVTGSPLPTLAETEVIGPGPVYCSLDPSTGAPTDVATVGTIDEFEIEIRHRR